ncbi:MAG: hypothetical protein KC474_04160 [Cyanobacteria bacterium HKST-UBA04]|nr:hypothetical protein [Cyanobacteria bacterium HKST-UBA04]
MTLQRVARPFHPHDTQNPEDVQGNETRPFVGVDSIAMEDIKTHGTEMTTLVRSFYTLLESLSPGWRTTSHETRLGQMFTKYATYHKLGYDLAHNVLESAKSKPPLLSRQAIVNHLTRNRLAFFMAGQDRRIHVDAFGFDFKTVATEADRKLAATGIDLPVNAINSFKIPPDDQMRPILFVIGHTEAEHPFDRLFPNGNPLGTTFHSLKAILNQTNMRLFRHRDPKTLNDPLQHHEPTNWFIDAFGFEMKGDPGQEKPVIAWRQLLAPTHVTRYL